jgi:hypothetical protein
MKAKAWVLVSAILFFAVFVCAGSRQEAQESTPRKAKGQTSLVRKDLLQPTRKQLSPPLRNIFTRQRISSSGEGSEYFGEEQRLSPRGTPFQAVSENQNAEISINVKYIGYVNSEKRVIALIILNGETYAVESGDMLEGGVHIGEITPDDIEVIGPDSESNKVKLEGEKP